MSIRWRIDGRLVCAAMNKAEEDDTYIDDRLHHQLSAESKAIIADVNHILGLQRKYSLCQPPDRLTN